MSIIKGLLDLFYPPKCAFCGRLLGKETEGMCAVCAGNLPKTEGTGVYKKGEFFDLCVSPLYYKDNVRKSLLRFKFSGITGYAPCYSLLLAECIREELSDKYDIISWVPISRRRKRLRGYDQSQLLAELTARELGEEAVGTLRKIREVPAQSTLEGVEKRRANVIDVYEAVDAELISGKRVLLVDDIITTGATLSECARTLLMAGADSVLGAALAKSD